MTNGYIVLTKGDSKLYEHAVEAINLGKPVYYADGNKVAFVNSIELVSTDVVIKTSDKQITVEADGTATEVEKGLYHYYVHIKDSGDDYIYYADFESSNDYTDITFDDLINELKVNQIIFSDGTTELSANNQDYAYINRIENNLISIMSSKGTDRCDISREYYELIGFSKKKIF